MGRSAWQPPSVLFRPRDIPVADDVIDRALKRGDLVRLHRGVYVDSAVVPDDPVDFHLMRAAAVQMARPGLVASHGTAALAQRLPLVSPDLVANADPVFTRPPGPGRRSEKYPRVVLRALRPSAVAEQDHEWGSLRVTDPARTAVDLAHELPLPEALMVTDRVAREAAAEVATVMDLRGPLHPRLRTVALRALREAQVAPVHRRTRVNRAIEMTDPRRESPGESISFGHIIEAGLPVPQCQMGITTDGRRVFVDFWWEEYGLAGECDGRIKYDGTLASDAGVLVREADRHHALVAGGVDVIRWLASDMMFRPATVLARIAARLRGHGWRG